MQALLVDKTSIQMKGKAFKATVVSCSCHAYMRFECGVEKFSALHICALHKRVNKVIHESKVKNINS